MKKSLNININGIVFHIDEDAYEKLKAYLERLKQHFSQQEGGEEVVNDIEARIAELIRDKLNENKQVVTIEDVDEIIKKLGEPAEMMGDEEQEEKPPRFSFSRPKRLYRDPDSKIIGGVGGGMGAYFNTDPLWFRLLFVLSFFVVGPLAYIIFWIAIPKARTTSEKLEMKGKKVNIDNIEQSVKEEFKDISESFEKYTSKAKNSYKKNKQEYKDTTDTVLEGLYQILVFGAKVLGVILGIVFIFTGLVLLAGFLGLAFLPEIPMIFTSGYPVLFSLNTFLDMIFSGGLDTTFIILGLIIGIGLPLAGLIILGLRLIFGPRIKTHYFDITALIVWIAAITVTFISIAFTVDDFRYEETAEDKIYLNLPEKDEALQFTVNMEGQKYNYHDFNDYIFYNTGEPQRGMRDDFLGRPGVGIYSSEDSTAYIILQSKSHGKNLLDAKNKAKNISYELQQIGNKIILNPWFYLPEGEKFRAQYVYLKVYLPENTLFSVDDNIEEIVYPWYLDDDEMFIIKDNEIEEIENQGN